MSDYRRYYVEGGTYFFTVVTHHRRPIFSADFCRRSLHQAIEKVRNQWPWEIVAIILLPDHLHTIWTLPQSDCNYSLRWQKIKEYFSKTYIVQCGNTVMESASRVKKGETEIWQRRFWEHTCRDEEDLKRCLDYIHWNPVKHGLVSRVVDYPWSTFHRYVKLGEYEDNWGGENPCPGFEMPE